MTSAADAFLGQGSFFAFTRNFTQIEAPSARPRLRRVSSDSSLTVRPPIPTISVTLHQTGNSISSFSALTQRLPPPRRSSVSFAPTPDPPPRRPRSASPSRRNADRNEHWLALPPLQTRRRRHPTLTRSTSSPQLTSFAAAGISFASDSTPSEAGKSRPSNAVHELGHVDESDAASTYGATVSDSENVKGKSRGSKRARTKEKVKKLCIRSLATPPPGAAAAGGGDAWEKVDVDAKGSPNTQSVPDDTTIPVTAPAQPLSQATATEDTPQPQRPHLRKSKTLGDLLRRVPSSPGPVLPNPESKFAHFPVINLSYHRTNINDRARIDDQESLCIHLELCKIQR